MSTIPELVEEIKNFQKRHTDELSEVKTAVENMQKMGNRPAAGGPARSLPNTPEVKALDGAVRALLAGNQEKANALFLEAKAMQAGSDPDGGYVVHDMMSSGMTKIMVAVSPIYRLARKVDMTGGVSFEEVIDKDLAASGWVSELAARTDTETPDLAKFRVELNELYAMPKASQLLIDQGSLDVIDWLQMKVGEAFAVKESTAYHSGTGVGQPRGLLTYTMSSSGDATRTWGQFQYVPTGAAGAFHTTKMDPLHDIVAALKPQYRSGAVWLMNRTVASTLRKMKEATSDQYLWQTSVLAGQPDTLLGYPVEIDDDMPDAAANTLSVAFGNVQKAYCIVQRPGVRYLTDPFTDKPNVRLYGYRRVGAGAYNTEALKFLKFSAT